MERDLKGCFHSERPKTKTCNNCGSSLCFECNIEDVISTRITEYTKVDQRISQDFGFFCPSCYIERIYDSNYSKFYLHRPPNIINPFSLHKSKIYALVPPGIIIFGLLLAFFIFPGGGEVGGGIIIAIGLFSWLLYYGLSKMAFNEFNKKKQKALDLLDEHKRLDAKLQPPERTPLPPPP